MANSIKSPGNDNVRDQSVVNSAGSASPGPRDALSAIARISDEGVLVQFLKAGAGPQGQETASTALVSEGAAGKSNAQVAATTAGFGIAWLESDGEKAAIKLHGVSADGTLFGTEVTVGAAGRNNHSFSIDGHNVSGEYAEPGRDGRARAIEAADARINVSWVESLAGDNSGVGRIMLARYHFVLDDHGKPIALTPAGVNTQSNGSRTHDQVTAGAGGADNDNAVWVGDESGCGLGGAAGRDPAIAGLLTGDILVSWIDADNRVHGKLYPSHADVAPFAASTSKGTQAAYARINSALTNIGEAAAVEIGARRLQVLELTPGNFAIMWIAAGTDGLQLSGHIYSKTRSNSDEQTPTDAWASSAIGPIVLPRYSTGEFWLSAAGQGGSDLFVTYGARSATTGAVETFSRHIDARPGGPDTLSSTNLQVDKPLERPNSDGLAGSHHSQEPLLSLPDQATGKADTPTAVSLLDIAATASGEFVPIVSATDEILIVAWETPGAEPGRVTINLRIYDTQGAAAPGSASSDSAIEVTRNADAGVTPAISGLGSSTIVVWVDADTHALMAQGFNVDGQAFGPANGIVVGSDELVSEIAVASLALDRGSAPYDEDQGAKATSYAPTDDQFAIVWVEDADAGGYGDIMLQRYAVPHDGDGREQSPFALGRDGQRDGSNEPEQVTISSGSEVTAVEGRAPQVVGLRDGELALVWVQNTNSGEDIRGEVLDTRDGHQVVLIDLNTQLGGAVLIEPGTKPILSSLGEHGFLVSWLQPSGDGVDLVGAHYRAVGPNAWLPPEQVIQLRHFDRQPSEFSVVVADDENISLLVTWRESDSSHDVQGQQFDILGNKIGNVFDVTGGKRQAADDTSAIAGLPDGNVVLTEESRNGDGDILAHVFATSTESLQVSQADRSGGTTGYLDNERSDGQGTTSTLQLAGDWPASGVEDSSANGDRSGSTDSLPDVEQGSDRESSGTQQVSLVPAPAATKNMVVAPIDPTDGIAIEVLPDVGASHIVAAIDGVAVETPATGHAAPIRVADGFVQLRSDGQIVFSPDMNFEGSATFGCTIASAATGEQIGMVTVSVVEGSSGRADVPAPTDAGHNPEGVEASLFGDTLVFAEAFGNDRRAHEQHVIDLSSSGYATFEALRDAGALTEVGDDVVITLNPADPAHSDKVTLKFVTLQTLDATDFRFS